jgi:biotin transporter BioY
MKYLVLIYLYVTALPFYFALYQAFRLLNYIDQNKAFSELSVNALKLIKYCAVTISVLYAAGMPLFYLMAEIDDAPGIIVIGLVIIFASMVIAVFAAVLQKLLKEAIDIKSENDLTV